MEGGDVEQGRKIVLERIENGYWGVNKKIITKTVKEFGNVDV